MSSSSYVGNVWGIPVISQVVAGTGFSTGRNSYGLRTLELNVDGTTVKFNTNKQLSVTGNQSDTTITGFLKVYTGPVQIQANTTITGSLNVNTGPVQIQSNTTITGSLNVNTGPVKVSNPSNGNLMVIEGGGGTGNNVAYGMNAWASRPGGVPIVLKGVDDGAGSSNFIVSVASGPTGALIDRLTIRAADGFTRLDGQPLIQNTNTSNAGTNNTLRVSSGAATGGDVVYVYKGYGVNYNIRSDAEPGADTFGNHIIFLHGISGPAVGSIRTSSTSTTYNTTSDYRLKENVKKAPSGLTTLVQNLPLRQFNFIHHPETVSLGFLAHELQDILPGCVVGVKDAVDNSGKPDYQGVDYSKIVPYLIGCIQELTVRIENLERNKKK